MAKTTDVYSIKTVNNVDGRIQNSDTTSKITVWTAGSDDGVLKSLGLSSTDTAAAIINVYVNVGGAGTDRLMGAVPVPALSGFNGTTSPVDVLAFLGLTSLDAYGNRVYLAQAGTTIKIAAQVTLTSGKEVDAFGEGGNL
jgi:hypothetical protein